MKRTSVANARNTSTLSELKSLVSKARSIAILDYTGLKVGQATQLRRDVRRAGGEMKVAKNTLFKIASGKTDLALQGLSAFIFALQDEITPLKAVADFIKKSSVGVFKGGLLGDTVLTQSETINLANTPSREVSVGKLLYLLNFNMSKLVRTLDAIAKKEVTN